MDNPRGRFGAVPPSEHQHAAAGQLISRPERFQSLAYIRDGATLLSLAGLKHCITIT
jgi:hypothetical protein